MIEMGFWTRRKVLVTGGAGFVGSHLVDLLNSQGAEVRVADNLSRGRRVLPGTLTGDLRDLEQALIAAQRQEVVFHLAARVAGIQYNRTHQRTMWADNVRINSTVLEAALMAGVEKYIFTSTACIYPHDAAVPTPEAEGNRGVPEPTNVGYGWAKRLGEQEAQWASQEHKSMQMIVVRPFNAYGCRDYDDPATSHVIPALIRKVLADDEPVTVWGSGKQTRAFLHVKDFAEGLMRIAESATDSAPINLGHDNEVSIKELMEMILEITGQPTREVVYDTDMPEGYPRRAADTTRLREVTGWVPHTKLFYGLSEVIDEIAARRSPRG